MRSHRAGRVSARFIYAGVAAYAVATLWRYPPWTVDDAYIVFRYAKHLVEHGQLTWTVGAAPVEGYTGIALPLLVAAGLKLGVAPDVTARLLGLGGLAVGAWTLSDNQRLLGVREPVRAYVTAIALLFAPLYAHATGGLETMLFAGLLGACFGAWLRCCATPRPSRAALVWLASGLLTLALVRPEGVLCAGAFGSALAWRHRRSPESLRRAGVIGAGLFALPYAAYFAWRLHYYGRLFPNTYYAKHVAGGLDGDFLFVGWALLEVFAPVVVVAIGLAAVRRRVRVPRLAIVVPFVIVLVAAAQYSRSVLVMNYLFRFQVHFLFLLLPLVGAILPSLSDLRALPRRLGVAKGWAVAGLVAVCAVALPVELVENAASVRALTQRYLDIQTDQPARMGAWLSEHLPPSEAIACWVDAGLIPFVADDHMVIDFGRLNDAYLARPGIRPDEVADYFFARLPGALELTCDSATCTIPQHQGTIVTLDPRFAAYQARLAFCSPEHPEAPCEVLFLRQGVTIR
jgi:arabinofuranosyltransferase